MSSFSVWVFISHNLVYSKLNSLSTSLDPKYLSDNDAYIYINWFTDDVWSAKDNRTLSQNRADAVKEYLKKLIWIPARISASWQWETNFIYTNSTIDRDKSRRVEIDIR